MCPCLWEETSAPERNPAVDSRGKVSHARRDRETEVILNPVCCSLSVSDSCVVEVKLFPESREALEHVSDNALIVMACIIP